MRNYASDKLESAISAAEKYINSSSNADPADLVTTARFAVAFWKAKARALNDAKQIDTAKIRTEIEAINSILAHPEAHPTESTQPHWSNIALIIHQAYIDGHPLDATLVGGIRGFARGQLNASRAISEFGTQITTQRLILDAA